MIQDIAPHRYDVTFREAVIAEEDYVLYYKEGKALTGRCGDEVTFPTVARFREQVKTKLQDFIYLFSIDQKQFWGMPFYEQTVKEWTGFSYEPVNQFRFLEPMYLSFAGITGYQMHTFYWGHQYCAACGRKLAVDGKERAMRCDACGKVYYPVICPSVIVALTDKDKILLTKYQATHSSYRNYALIAGYGEIGESLEETVRREVFEEVGLHVKNIRYYKSQPWSFSGALLTGFFCEVDGDDTITLEEDELCEAEWFRRDCIPVNPSRISLTNEMIEYFRHGRIMEHE